jgi:hypothetical protein
MIMTRADIETKIFILNIPKIGEIAAPQGPVKLEVISKTPKMPVAISSVSPGYVY